MQNVTLKLKQASAVLGVTAKDLQNLVQMGIIHPSRRGKVCWFDSNVLLEAKIAFYLKDSLGSSSDLLALFTEAFSQNLRSETKDLADVCLQSRPVNGTDAVEIKIPVRSLARELESRLPLASAAKDLPKGRKKVGWGKDLLQAIQKAATEMDDVPELQIQTTVREHRSKRKKLPEITIVARTKKKTA